jgi:hypothetical protein
MSDFGLFASRFRDSSNSLRLFDEALRYFKQSKAKSDSDQAPVQRGKLLSVLRPVTELLQGRLSDSRDFDEQNVVETLQRRHPQDWQRFRTQMVQLTVKLKSAQTSLGKDDFVILNDVADAIDTECASLFRRMSGRA